MCVILAGGFLDPLPFNPRQRDTLHKGLLEEEEDEDNGQCDQNGCSHQ